MVKRMTQMQISILITLSMKDHLLMIQSTAMAPLNHVPNLN